MKKVKRKSKFTFLVFLTTFVTLTKTYVVFAYFFKVNVAIITALFFLINIIIIFKFFKVLKNKNDFFVFFQFLILLPLIVSIINLNFSENALLLQFFYFSQVAIGAIIIINFRTVLIKVIPLIVIFNFFAGIISMFKPDYFIEMSKIIDSNFFYGGRAIGFFLQPNSLGLATAIVYILLIFICSKKQQLSLLPFIIITSLFTGSRSGIIILTILILINVFFQFKENKKSIIKLIKSFIKFSFILLSIAILFFSTNYSKILINDVRYSSLISRIQFFLNFNSDTIKEDGSLEKRYEYQQSYLKNFDSFIVKGKGFGTQKEARTHNILLGSAHQTFLEILFQGGIFYLISYLIVLFYILNIFYKNKTKNKDKSIFAFMVFVFMFIISFVSTGMLSMRELYLTLGILIQYPPEKNIQIDLIYK